MPARHFITKEESMMLHIRLTLLLGRNMESNYKLQLRQVYLAGNTRACKRNNTSGHLKIQSLGHYLRSGFHIIFLYWKLKKYYKNNEILFNVLLLIDNVASYPTLFRHYHSNGENDNVVSKHHFTLVSNEPKHHGSIQGLRAS